MDQKERGAVLREIESLESLDSRGLYGSDFLLSWDKSTEELRAVLTVARLLRAIRDHGISPRIFDSGLALAIFRDKSTRTRFSFLSAGASSAVCPMIEQPHREMISTNRSMERSVR